MDKEKIKALLICNQRILNANVEDKDIPMPEEFEKLCSNNREAIALLDDCQTCGGSTWIVATKEYGWKPGMPSLMLCPDCQSDSKYIPLTKNQFAIVDSEDYEKLIQWSWCLGGKKADAYCAQRGVRRNGNTTSVYMHRQIMCAKDGEEIDHINHNGLDNRKCNLRKCTRSQNSYNQAHKKGYTSKYKGIHWKVNRGKWIAQIKKDGVKVHLGSFDDEIEAAKTYDAKAKELFGEFACLNFPESQAPDHIPELAEDCEGCPHFKHKNKDKHCYRWYEDKQECPQMTFQKVEPVSEFVKRMKLALTVKGTSQQQINHLIKLLWEGGNRIILLEAATKRADAAEKRADKLMQSRAVIIRENKQLQTQKDAILLQARIWSGEAKTQRRAVNEIGSVLGGMADWQPIVKVIKQLQAEIAKPKGSHKCKGCETIINYSHYCIRCQRQLES